MVTPPPTKQVFSHLPFDPTMTQGQPVVLNLGGSVLMPEEPSADYLVKVAACLVELTGVLGRLFVVVGGGRTARRYITLARKAGELGTRQLTEPQLDDLGIDATRLNARLLLAAMQTRGGLVPWEVPADLYRATALGEYYDCVVMGGTVPGHTTDAVAADLARAVGARRLVIATNVKGIYTSDPRQDPEAEFLAELSFERLMEIVGPVTEHAGQTAVVDPVAARTAASIDGLKLAVVSGDDLANLAAVCKGEAFEGSLVQD